MQQQEYPNTVKILQVKGNICPALFLQHMVQYKMSGTNSICHIISNEIEKD